MGTVEESLDQQVMNERLMEEIAPQISPWTRFGKAGGFDALVSAVPVHDDRVTVEVHRADGSVDVRRVRRDWSQAIEAILTDGAEEPEPPIDRQRARLTTAIQRARWELERDSAAVGIDA